MSRRFFAAAYVVAATVLVLGLLSGPAFAGSKSNQAVLLRLEGKPLQTTGELTAGTTFVPVEALSVELGFDVSSMPYVNGSQIDTGTVTLPSGGLQTISGRSVTARADRNGYYMTVQLDYINSYGAVVFTDMIYCGPTIVTGQ